MILHLISIILLGLALLYFIGQRIYYYYQFYKLKEGIKEIIENEKSNNNK